MAQCVYCKAETELYYSETPICTECSSNPGEAKRKPQATESQIRTTLTESLAKATARANVACWSFNAVTGQFPRGFAHPDGTQRILNASHELSAARKEMMRAHNRLNDYLGRGIVPDDLKLKGSAGQS
jgi:hypothetical protein